jgi:hypothetical protein
MELDPSTPLVRVKLVRNNDQEFGPASWEVSGALSCSAPNRSSVWDAGKLRGSGTITFAIERFEPSPCEMRFVVRVHSPAQEELGGLFTASLGPGMNDLGTLVLQPGTLLCSGVVVDSHGAGVAGRDIQLELPFHSRGVRAMLASPAISGADGHFELRGWGEAGQFALSQRSDMVRLGDTNVRIADND